MQMTTRGKPTAMVRISFDNDDGTEHTLVYLFHADGATKAMGRLMYDSVIRWRFPDEVMAELCRSIMENFDERIGMTQHQMTIEALEYMDAYDDEE